MKQITHSGDKPIEIDSLRRERLAARKRKQSLGQRRCPLGALLCIVHRAARSRDFAIRERAARHVDIADDDCQKVVKVVRNAAGELAQGFHFLRLAQRLLHALAFRYRALDAALQVLVHFAQSRLDSPPMVDINENSGKSERRAVRAQVHPPIRLDPAIAAVLLAHAIFAAVGAAALKRVGDRPGDVGLVLSVDRFHRLR